MKICIKCGAEFKNRSSKKFCSVECSGVSSRNRTHGLCETPEYNSWTSMRERCNNKNRPAYQQYGARGITYCQRWEVFENFLEDMGYRPSPSHTLERIDNNGNYEPLNCKWATKLEQSRNRSCSWSLGEDGQLARSLADGLRFDDISPILNKSKSAIAARARRLNLKSRRGAGGILLPLSEPLHEENT